MPSPAFADGQSRCIQIFVSRDHRFTRIFFPDGASRFTWFLYAGNDLSQPAFQRGRIGGLDENAVGEIFECLWVAAARIATTGSLLASFSTSAVENPS